MQDMATAHGVRECLRIPHVIGSSAVRHRPTTLSGVLSTGIIVAYCAGVLCTMFPRISGTVIAEALDFITKHKYGAPPEDQKRVRPVFAVIVGCTSLALTVAVQSGRA